MYATDRLSLTFVLPYLLSVPTEALHPIIFVLVVIAASKVFAFYLIHFPMIGD